MSSYVSPEALVNGIPLERGDTILIASNVERLVWNAVQDGEDFDFDLFINLLQERVGEEGNILFPTYNWDFCHGEVWNYHKTKSQTGSLSQIALKRPDFTRTKHALYSFAVWGRDTEKLFKMENRNSFAGDTPFAFLHHTKDAKMITLDVDLTRCFTFVHYVEEVDGVPYRFLKHFTAGYIDEKGQESTRTYSMCVRYLDRKVETDFSGLEENLIKEHKMTQQDVGGITIRVLRFADAYESVDEDIQKGIYHNIVRLD